MSEPTDKERAAAYRLAAEFVDDLKFFSSSLALERKADELDPPLPPEPPVGTYLPRYGGDGGRLRLDTGWHSVYAEGRPWSEVHYFLTVTAEPSTPRVLNVGDPCPEVGSRWRDAGGDVASVVAPGMCRWVLVNGREFESRPVWPWADSYAASLTEVLDGES